MLLPKLKRLIKAYDSLYDLNSLSAYKYGDVLKQIETDASEYGYKIKLDATGNRFKLYKKTAKELLNKEVEE